MFHTMTRYVVPSLVQLPESSDQLESAVGFDKEIAKVAGLACSDDSRESGRLPTFVKEDQLEKSTGSLREPILGLWILSHVTYFVGSTHGM